MADDKATKEPGAEQDKKSPEIDLGAIQKEIQALKDQTLEARAETKAQGEAYQSFVRQIAGIGSQPTYQEDIPTDEEAISKPVETSRRIAESVAREVESRVGGELSQQRLQNHEIQMELVRNRAPEMFDRFKGEIEKEFAARPHMRGTPDAVRTVFDLVKGRHADELIKETREKAMNDPSIRPGSGSEKDSDKPEISADEIEIALGLHGRSNPEAAVARYIKERDEPSMQWDRKYGMWKVPPDVP